MKKGASMQEYRITSSQIQLFNNESFGDLRVIVREDAPWFVAADLCRVLGIANPSVSVASLDGDERAKFNLGRQGETNIVSEPGFYKLVMRSRKPEAKAFQRWVTHEVLPAIRRTGGYMVAKADETPMETVSRALIIAKEAIDRRDERIARLEADGAAKDAEIARIAPKAAFSDRVLDSEGTYSVTEAARLLKQVDPSIGQKKLFGLLRADQMLEKHSNKATALAVERGYLYNYIPEPYEDPVTGEKKLRAPYARVTAKGLRWMNGRYCRKGEVA